MKITFDVFSKEPLFQNSSSLLCWLLHQMEEGKGKDEGGENSGRALHHAGVWLMCHISSCDEPVTAY